MKILTPAAVAAKMKRNMKFYLCSVCALVGAEGVCEVREEAERAKFGLRPTEREMKSNVKQEPVEKKEYFVESEKEKPKSRSKKTTSAVS